MQSRDAVWTLEELSAQVALALAPGSGGSVNGRAREVPDARTIRYYTTLGLIDRPAGFRGRTALYGRRHLLQLVAVKRLQARGLSLAEVQARLVGLTDSALGELAQLPAGGTPSPGPQPAGGRRSSAFWNTPPAPRAEEPPAEQPAPAVTNLVGVPLEGGATLLLDAARPLDGHDLEALRVAAAPLLKFLRARRLLNERGTS